MVRGRCRLQGKRVVSPARWEEGLEEAVIKRDGRVVVVQQFVERGPEVDCPVANSQMLDPGVLLG